LRFVSNHVSRGFSEKLATRAVTVAEWVVLRELFGHEGVVASDLATRLGMTRGGISKIIDRLESRGLLHRVSDQEDRRFQGLALTSAGRALVPRLATLADQNEAEYFGHLPAAKRAALEATLKELVSHHRFRTIPIE
jgi:DNA-binding MarR family transcriptional regulator